MDGGETGEARGLSRFEAAEFRHFNEQGECGDTRDAGNGEKNLEPAGKERVAFDTLLDGDVDFLDFSVDFGDALFVLLFE